MPARIAFVAGDAIIGGKIRWRGIDYWAKGRIEPGSWKADFTLIRRSDDPKPLFTVSTPRADGSWNGVWESYGAGCKGDMRILRR